MQGNQATSLDDMDGPLFDLVYEFTTESGKEEEHMELYRESLAKAAFEINETLPLEAFPKLTNDFVVVLADGSRWRSGEPENVLMCISKDKRRMLIDRGFWREDDRY